MMTDEELSLFRRLVESNEKIAVAMPKPQSAGEKAMAIIAAASAVMAFIGAADIIKNWIIGG